MSEAVEQVQEQQGNEAEASTPNEVSNQELQDNVSAPEKQTLDFSKQFADLKKQQREIRAKELQAQDRAKKTTEQWKAEVLKDPIGKLKEWGVNLQTLTTGLLDNPVEQEPDETEKLKQQIAEMQQWKQAQEQQKSHSEQQQAINEYKAQVFADLEVDTDKFELVLNHPQGKDLMWEAVTKYAAKYKEAPTPEERLEMANQLESKLYEDMTRMYGLKKFSSLLKPEGKSQEKQPKDNAVSQNEKPSGKFSQTLTGAMSPRIKMSSQASTRQAIDFDSKADAIYNKFFK